MRAATVRASGIDASKDRLIGVEAVEEGAIGMIDRARTWPVCS